MNFGSLIWSFFEVTKPRSVFLLVFTSIGAMVAASRLEELVFSRVVLAIVAITAGCAGCNTVTCYIDRDIDAIMERTKNRPLPYGRINPPEKALYFGLFLILLSFILAWMLNPLPFLCMFLGVLDNVVIYSLLLKRRNPLNVVLGGLSGGLPALFGWTVVTNSVNPTAILISALVILWIPSHIWSLVIFFSEDYMKAKIPMLPTVLGLKKSLNYIIATVVLLFPISIMIYFIGDFGLIYLSLALISGFLIVAVNLHLFLHPTKNNAWQTYKLSSPYLFILFLGIILDSLL